MDCFTESTNTCLVEVSSTGWVGLSLVEGASEVCAEGFSKAWLMEICSIGCVEGSSITCAKGLSKASLVEICSMNGIESSSRGSIEYFSEG